MTILKDIRLQHDNEGTELYMEWATRETPSHRYQAIALDGLDPESVIHMLEDAIRFLEKEIKEGYLI